MPLPWFNGLLTITVEAAFSAATGSYGAWGASLWDTATWGPDVVWQDVSAYCRSVKTDRAFGTDVKKWGGGTASVVLSNRDGRFSADNLSGPYVTAGVTGIRPWRPIRVRATQSGVTYDLFNGYILDYVDTWIPGHLDAFVTLPCVDEWAAIQGFDGLEQAPVGASELSGARIHRVLNNAGHTGLRNVALGRVTMQATTLASNAATEMDLTVDSEGGGLFIDADGTVVFEDQYALMEQTRSNTVQAVFGDGSGPELPCADITPVNGGQTIKNIVSYARVGGTAQTTADATSRALYKDKRLTRTDLACETDVQALALATFDLEVHKAPKKLFSAIQVLPIAKPAALFPQVLGRRMRDLVRVVARPMGSPTVTRDCHVAGVHHQITADNWVTDFDLWDATVYQTYSGSRWDVGVWDSAAWFF
jgi:hypothetical protein